MLKKILLTSSILVAQNSDIYFDYTLGSTKYIFGTENTIIIKDHDPFNIIEITILGDNDGIQSSYYKPKTQGTAS